VLLGRCWSLLPELGLGIVGKDAAVEALVNVSVERCIGHVAQHAVADGALGVLGIVAAIPRLGGYLRRWRVVSRS